MASGNRSIHARPGQFERAGRSASNVPHAQRFPSIGASRATIVLIALLVGAAILRLTLLLSPLGEMEADEAVVGLMAWRILHGEHPVFYWGQAYLGSLEAYSVAAAFAIFGATPFVLKAVPLFYSVVFIAIASWSARLTFGQGPALLTALYLAVPPLFLATWSIKARGGYIEMLVLGQLIFLIVVLIEQRRERWNVAWASGLGVVAGLAFWTDPLAIVYIAPAYGLLVVRRRTMLAHLATLALVVGSLVGAGPLIGENLANGFPTWHALFSGGFNLGTSLRNLAGQVRYSLPILIGLAQASTAPDLFAADFPRRLGHWPVVPPVLALLCLATVVFCRRSLIQAFRRGAKPDDLGTALALLLVVANGTITAGTRFGELTTEPRYLLPIYSAVPLFAALVWHLRRRWRLGFGLALLLIFSINISSLATADPRLNLPSHIGPSSAATRAELARFLTERGLTHVYTDYWIAYPLMLETREGVVASVTAAGYNRYLPYAHEVSQAPTPAFVFVAGLTEEAAFREKLSSANAVAQRDAVSIYVVYHNVQPESALVLLR